MHYNLHPLFGVSYLMKILLLLEVLLKFIKPALLIKLLNLLINVGFKTAFVKLVVEVLGDDLFLLIFKVLGNERRINLIRFHIRTVVCRDILLLLCLLIISFEFLDVSVPWFHVHFSLFLLHLDVL